MLRINGEVCLLEYDKKDFTLKFDEVEEEKNITKFASLTIRKRISCKM